MSTVEMGETYVSAATAANMSAAESPTQKIEASPRRWARIAGLLYLINIIGGFFAIGYVPAAIVVSGDAAATATNILAHEGLYRAGIAIHLIVLLTNVPLALIFYELFKVVNRRLALMVMFFLLVGTAIEGAYLLNQFAPLVLLDGRSSLSGLSADQLQALVSEPLKLQAIGYSLAQVFYVGYLLLAGYLILRSAFIPRVVGALLTLGGLCYLVYSFADILAPAFAAHLVPYIQLASGLGELALCLCLLIVGVNVQRRMRLASAARGS